MNKQNISDRPLRWNEKLLLWLVPLLVTLFQRFIGFTSRRVDSGREGVDALRATGKPFIYAIWHRNVLFSPYLLRNQNTAVMISASRDGEFIHRVVKTFGNFSVRGSTSRGGIAALKSLARHLEAGNSGAITPDGPRGPALKLQGGILTAAQRSGAAIVPFAYECTRQWVAEKAWDKHRIPKPFTTFVVSYGEPISVPAELDADEYEVWLNKIEAALLRNLETCLEKTADLRRKNGHRSASVESNPRAGS